MRDFWAKLDAHEDTMEKFLLELEELLFDGRAIVLEFFIILEIIGGLGLFMDAPRAAHCIRQKVCWHLRVGGQHTSAVIS